MAFIGDMLGLLESCNHYDQKSGGVNKKTIFVPSRHEFFIARPFLLLLLRPTQVNAYWKVFQILSPEMTTSWQVCVRLWSSLLDHSAVKILADQQTRL